MPNFVMTQVEQVNGGTMVVPADAPYDRQAVSYSGKDPNKPINLDDVSTFEKEEFKDLNNITFPIIRFNKIRENVATRWYYPPTDKGRARRDAEYLWLLANYVRSVLPDLSYG